MDPRAIAQANQRLEKCRDALSVLRRSATYADHVEAWSEFLLHANAIYSKLEQGAKASPKSEAWYGRKKSQRKKDELLQYIHQARNSTEHGIEPTTYEGSLYFIRKGKEIVVIPTREGEKAVTILQIGDNGPAYDDYVVQEGTLVLKTVRSRFGDTFDPPSEHLGKPIIGKSPLAVANAGFDFLASLITEAQGFV